MSLVPALSRLPFVRTRLDYAGRLETETCTSGEFSGITLVHHYHSLYGRDQFKVQGTTPLLQHDFGFDPSTGRLNSVTAGSGSVTYGYWPDSDLVQQSSFKYGGTEQLLTSRVWEYGTRLQSIANTAWGLSVSAHAYQYDSVNRRWRAALADGSRWDYGYDDRNEVTSGKRYWPDGSAVAGQHFEYNYDTIGNRTWARLGGDVNGANLRQTDYTPNELNQYAAILTPGYQAISGVAAAASVTVNGLSASRKGEYYHREITVANGAGPVWQEVTVSAGSQGQSKKLLFPPQTQNAGSPNPLSYDLDGNLQSDGLWNYVWDAENRLLKMTSAPQVADAAKRELEFRYDRQGRRIKKTVKTYSGGSYVNPVTTRYVYDGWRLVAELNGNTVLRSYLWGKDLSGSLDGAGGVSGLVAVTDHTNGAVYFPAYDGNGNVTALVKATGQSVSARYEYGPFGELIRATGPLAEVNPFRWSTKCYDEETGLSYYGYRYYSASLGKWTSRDAAQERGGNNLYHFNFNNPVNRIDSLGDISGGWDANGFHLHDGDLTYGVRPSGNGYEVFANPTHPGAFNQEKAAASFKNFLSTEKGVKQFQSMIQTLHQPNVNYGSAWNALPNYRDLMRGMGRNSWRALKAAGKVAGVVAIVGALQATSQAATVAENYSRALQRGDTPMADLEGIELAILIHEGTGNYFMGYLALDVLLE
ncbi:MAG: RHS repeat-associated core domain-containing protein [Chloroflexi bacterium]|nr:RHS repeat-associated core domain-containing protein [Chloroflexota bacterium]